MRGREDDNMSYEGYEEYLCENGHYFTHNAYSTVRYECPNCQARVAYRHSVDTANGYGHDRFYCEQNNEEYDNSFYDESAPKMENRWDDIWRTDHYGTRYAEKLLKYLPDLTVPNVWKRLT